MSSYSSICEQATRLLRVKKNLKIEFSNWSPTSETKFPHSITYLACYFTIADGHIRILIPETYFCEKNMGIDTSAGIRDVFDFDQRYILRVAYDILQCMRNDEYEYI